MHARDLVARFNHFIETFNVVVIILLVPENAAENRVLGMAGV